MGNELELLDWQFRIARMGRDELEGVVADLDAEEDRLSGMGESLAHARRAAIISNVTSMMSRPARAATGGDGKRGAGERETVSLDLSEYYAALETERKMRQAWETREAIRSMCERRLEHLDRRDALEYVPAESPLKAYIAELGARLD